MKEKRENEKQDITGKERKKETGKREGGKKIRRKRILAQSSERKPGPQPTALPSGGGQSLERHRSEPSDGPKPPWKRPSFPYGAVVEFSADAKGFFGGHLHERIGEF